MSSIAQPNVLWNPHPKQTEALERSEFEILYGGSRGGGKTDAGIIWMLNNTNNPKFRGLVLRRNTEDLKDWTDRANLLYSRLVNPAVKKGNPPEFHFESGAIIRTGHLKDDNAYTKYQGHEYHALLIEELTQIASERQYLSILSSCRSTVPGLKSQVFLTTNPGNSGHMWVKQRFIDPEPPGKTIWSTFELPSGKKIHRSRVFIQATMDDNPTLMEADPQYVANIEALKGVDDEKYRAWRFGDWDVFAGQVFREFRRNKHVIPPTIPRRSYTHVMWIDWGYAETSAFAGYLSAIIPMENGSTKEKFNRVVTYKEFYGNMTKPKDWANKIYKFCKANKIEPLYCASDPAMHSTAQSGDMSIAKMFEDEWNSLSNKRWCKIKKGSNSGKNSRVNRVGMMHEWLSIAPDKMPYWVFTESCTNAIRTLPMLVHDETQPEAYDTNGEDHCLHGDTDMVTLDGVKKIKDLVDTRGKVLSINNEWVDYHNCKMTRKNAEILEIIFEDGHKLKCTPDHKILTRDGMIEARYLIGRKCISYPQQSKSSADLDITSAGNTSCVMVRDCIEKCGSIIMNRYQRLTTLTILILIGIITRLRTLRAFLARIIYRYIQSCVNLILNTLRRLEKWLVSGIGRTTVGNGIKNIMRVWETSYTKRDMRGAVRSVARNTKHLLSEVSFALQLVLRRIGATLGKIIYKKSVLVARRYSPLTNTEEATVVQGHVLIECVGVGKLKERVDTYDITADKYHVFALSNGVIVSNSADSAAYGLEKIKFISVKSGVHNIGKFRAVVQYDKEGDELLPKLDIFGTMDKKSKNYFA